MDMESASWQRRRRGATYLDLVFISHNNILQVLGVAVLATLHHPPATSECGGEQNKILAPQLSLVSHPLSLELILLLTRVLH